MHVQALDVGLLASNANWIFSDAVSLTAFQNLPAALQAAVSGARMPALIGPATCPALRARLQVQLFGQHAAASELLREGLPFADRSCFVSCCRAE